MTDVDDLKKLASSGDAKAQYRLGIAYSFGLGTKRDMGRAIECFKQAAEQGDADSQRALGFRYAYGIGIEEDAEQAMHWYKKAAEQKHGQEPSNS